MQLTATAVAERINIFSILGKGHVVSGEKHQFVVTEGH